LEEPVRKYWAHHSPSLPTIAAQLLGEPAAGEPYTILIIGRGGAILLGGGAPRGPAPPRPPPGGRGGGVWGVCGVHLLLLWTPTIYYYIIFKTDIGTWEQYGPGNVF
jgi:hypothetical protein